MFRRQDVSAIILRILRWGSLQLRILFSWTSTISSADESLMHTRNLYMPECSIEVGATNNVFLQVDLVKTGKPYIMFGDGQLASCKPISESDLASYMADCIQDEDKVNQILPIGGEYFHIDTSTAFTMFFKEKVWIVEYVWFSPASKKELGTFVMVHHIIISLTATSTQCYMWREANQCHKE